MPQSNTAETIVVLASLAMLALGTLAVFARWLLDNRRSIARVGRQLVEDVQRGEGFTFHRQLGKRWPEMVQAAHEQKQADLLARLERLEALVQALDAEVSDLRFDSLTRKPPDKESAGMLLTRIEAVEDALAVRLQAAAPTADGFGTPDRQTDRRTDEARRDDLVRTMARLPQITRERIREAVKAAGYSIDNNTLSRLMQEAKQTEEATQ